MRKKRKKTDFTEQDERARRVRELLEREWAKLDAKRARERDEPKTA
ncbi:MAG TPA: hypothetical protein VNT23_05180 [Gaiellaceae bacterium]|nr:hypothetical protein [Gaiellaceae bacterium]